MYEGDTCIQRCVLEPEHNIVLVPSRCGLSCICGYSRMQWDTAYSLSLQLHFILALRDSYVNDTYVNDQDCTALFGGVVWWQSVHARQPWSRRLAHLPNHCSGRTNSQEGPSDRSSDALTSQDWLITYNSFF